MKTIAGLLLSALFVSSQVQRIEHWELRPAADTPRLYATIDGQDVLVSRYGVSAWPGWTPQKLIYAELANPESRMKRLRWFDSLTRSSFTIDTEELEYEKVTTVLLSTGQHAILIAIRDPESRVPYVALATPDGVFLREQFATYGAAINDHVEIQRFEPEDIQRAKGDLSLLTPSSVARVPLTPAAVPSAAGVYEAMLPAADAQSRTVTLNLRSGGAATMVTTYVGKGEPNALQGSWSQKGADVRVDFDGNLVIWTLSANGLAPKSWNRQEWGWMGLPLRRSTAPR